MSPRRIAMVACFALTAVAVAVWPRPEPTEAVATGVADRTGGKATSTALECRFERGATAAFAFESKVSLVGEGASAEDRFEGVLSWTVVEGARQGEPALLRASLTSVRLAQALSQERVSAAELEAGTFYVRIERSCRFAGFGFSPSWTPASRRLVTTLLVGYEFVLPGDGATHWQIEQRDGIGAFNADYRRASSADGTTIVRTKPRYLVDDAARQFGFRVQVLGARAEARFAPGRPGWMQQVEGAETVRFHLPGDEQQGFVHRFQLVRDDARFVAVSDALALAEADFSEVSADDGHAQPDPAAAFARLDHEAARAQFLTLLHDGGRRAIFPAARFLAGWLRAHPEETAKLLADLRRGEIDASAHSALFLAFELAGTGESRQVLAEALVDRQVAPLDRARAASALADHGDPSRQAAELLLAEARNSDSDMVANVSVLGVGSMAGRTAEGDPLRAELRTAMREELARAAGTDAELTLVDALGNSGDDAFAPALDERLRADRPALRAHAAEALGRLSPETARPLLLDQLGRETDAGVRTAIVRSLGRTAPSAALELTQDELALAARILASAESVEERTAVIDWLGRARQQHDARALLAVHFHREPNVRLQQRIGAFVPAGELRGRVQ